MSGKYTVPDSIKALKPKDIPCDIKVVGGKFYVYARGARVPDPNRPGKMKNTGGSLIGKITNGEYVPRSAEIKSVTDFTVIPSILDYGPYALALCCSEDILTRLKKHFTVQDAIRIYTIAVIWFVNGFTPARDLGEIYLQSVLSLKWPSVALSENTVSNFLALSLFLWDEPFLTVSEVLCPGPPQVPSALRASVLPGGPWEHRRGAHGLGTALSIRSSCTDFWMHP